MSDEMRKEHFSKKQFRYGKVYSHGDERVFKVRIDNSRAVAYLEGLRDISKKIGSRITLQTGGVISF